MIKKLIHKPFHHLIVGFTLCFLLFGCAARVDNHEPAFADHHYPEKAALPEIADRGHKVLRVKDGDTFVVLLGGKKKTVRFAHVDCPENGQAFGDAATEFVREACQGQYVQLVHDHEYDRYGRLIAEVILENGKNLNKELVRNGLAWHFKRYSADASYARLERKARKRRVGLWSERNPIAPWDWRKAQRKQNRRMPTHPR